MGVSGGIQIIPGYRLAVNFCDGQENGSIIYLNVTPGALQVAAKNAGYTIQYLILLVEFIINIKAVQS